MTAVINKNTDNKRNEYLNAYYNLMENAIVCHKGKNYVFKGVNKIVARTGQNSKYGQELIFQFLIKEDLGEYDADSEHNVIEYYLPLKEGIAFLEKTLKALKEQYGIN